MTYCEERGRPAAARPREGEIRPKDRQRLNGQVEQILQKGSYRLEDVVEEIKRIVEKQGPSRVVSDKRMNENSDPENPLL